MGDKANSNDCDDNAEEPLDTDDNVMRWRTHRISTITALKDMRKKINIVCVGANLFKAFGILSVLFGGVSSIVGGFMVFSESSSAVMAMNYGSIFYNSGAFVEALSNLIDFFAPVYCLDEVQDILKKDRELSETLSLSLGFPLKFDTKELLEELICNNLDSSLLKAECELKAMISSSKRLVATAESLNKEDYPVYYSMDIEIDSKILRFSEILTKNIKPDKVNKFKILLTRIVVKQGFDIYTSMSSHKASTAVSYPKNEKSNFSVNADGKKDIQNDGNMKSASTNNTNRPSKSKVSTFLALKAIETVWYVLPLLSAVMVIFNRKSRYSDQIDDIIRPLKRDLRRTMKRRLWTDVIHQAAKHRWPNISLRRLNSWF